MTFPFITWLMVVCSSFGLCPILYGYRGHFDIVHNFTSVNEPQQQSKHFFLIAFIGVNFAIYIPSRCAGATPYTSKTAPGSVIRLLLR